MVSEDFAYYQKEIPGFYFFVGIKNEAKKITAMWHTEFYDMDEAALPIGVRARLSVTQKGVCLEIMESAVTT